MTTDSAGPPLRSSTSGTAFTSRFYHIRVDLNPPPEPLRYRLLVRAALDDDADTGGAAPLVVSAAPGYAAVVGGWLLLGVGVLLAMVGVGDRPLWAVAYFAVWAVSTTVPGVLVWRALARPSTLVQELGFGSVLGIGLLLLAWLPATRMGCRC